MVEFFASILLKGNKMVSRSILINLHTNSLKNKLVQINSKIELETILLPILIAHLYNTVNL